MERHQLADLSNWLRSPRRKPLIVRGARQVGKSTMVELFAEGKGRDLRVVNLERHPDLADVFASNDPRAILNRLDTLAEAPLSERGILFLDEIQAAAAAIASLRYFFEELPDQPVVAAGSLMEFALADHGFPMPVGRVDYLNVGPMTFTEFLRATGKKGLASAIDEFEWPPQDDTAIPSVIHERLLEQLRVYQFVGGMPEAVQVYADSGSLRAVSTVHTSIVDTYR
ncbi:MAG: AAA family ATPase, partial [Gammaproteobacteria bacterium]|nr:AAA family ATPase [Gammaproteobacteria bacterium]